MEEEGSRFQIRRSLLHEDRPKRKGGFPCGKPPFLSDFLKLWFGFQITTLLSRSYQAFANRSPRSPNSFRDPTRCTSFLIAILETSSCPEAS